MRRSVLLGCVVLTSLALGAPVARADGDPASDVLFFQDVFFPYPPPPASARARLSRAVATTYARGFRIKVAVVATRTDLGSVPSLFNKPSAYGRFLGAEISSLFVGPLLIVMPSGFGIYDGGRSTKAERKALAKLTVRGPSATALTTSAAEAVEKLNAARALRSKDIRPPIVYPRPVKARPGEMAQLTYSVIDDSERSREVIRIYDGTNQLALIRVPLHVAQYNTTRVVDWNTPASLTGSKLRYCVTPTDRAGNTGREVCETIDLGSGP
jgi:hypothetical protein